MLKPCEMPMKMLKLEALSRRLSSNHPKQERIKNDFRKIRTGFNGERKYWKGVEESPEKNIEYFMI